jgi:DNA-binding LacI/PurR family transcriptional regulator/DNA-binding CsgD family transcriptional regulator
MNLRSRLVLNGVHEGAYQKKIVLRTFFSIEDLIKTLERERNKFAIVISESKLHSEKVLRTLNECGIHPIFINMQQSNTNYFFSSIIPNYYSAMYQLTAMVLNEFPADSAFIGYNTDSMSDRLRLEGFKKAAEECKTGYSVFSHHGNIDESIEEVLGNLDKFKNVICANDVIALALLRKMKSSGLDPSGFNITGSGNMKTGLFFKPSLTTIRSDYYNEGVMAVDAYAMLLKKGHMQNLFVNMDCQIIIRESTHITNKRISRIPLSETGSKMVDFYGNNLVQEIDRLEKMLAKCDDVDLEILNGIVRGSTYETIAESHLLAVNTVKYRIKKMEDHAEVKNRNELLSYIGKFDLDFGNTGM